MPGPADKKGMTDRDRRRLKAQQLGKTVTSKKNINTQTNLTYQKIIQDYDNERKKNRQET